MEIVSNYVDIIRNSKFRYFLFPVRSYELGKFIPMAMLMFFILLNQNLVRGIKDSLVVTIIGTEILSFIKLWCEAPFGILFVIIYSKLCNIMSTENVFRICVISFLTFFIVFAFFLLPNHENLHPDKLIIEHYIIMFPNLRWFIILWGKWTFVLFYVIGELWPVIVFSLLFWQLANKISKPEEAGRFYIFFNIFGQANLLISGGIMVYFSKGDHFLRFLFNNIIDNKELMVKSFSVLIICSGVIILMLHRLIELKNITYNKLYVHKENILKMGLVDSFRMVLSSKYLALICVLIISYSTTINLIEGVWMSRVKALHPDTNNFAAYQGNVLFWTGVSTLIFALCGSGIIRCLNWVGGAILTPLTILFMGGLFFISVIVEKYFGNLFLMLFSIKLLPIVVLLGSLQNIIGKGAKYSVFDATKEMVYLGLNDEMKTKGKAAVDVIGVKIGKSVGAVVQFTTFVLFPAATHEDIAGFLFLIFIIVCSLWIYGVIRLNRYYQKSLSS